jgi:hypothetical protein
MSSPGDFTAAGWKISRAARWMTLGPLRLAERREWATGKKNRNGNGTVSCGNSEQTYA